MSCCAGTDSRDQVRHFSSKSCVAGADSRDQFALRVHCQRCSGRVGFFWKVFLVKFFRIQCDAWLDSGYRPRRQFAKACAIILHIFFVTVNPTLFDSSKVGIFLFCFPALVGVFNAPEILTETMLHHLKIGARVCEAQTATS